MDWKRQWLGMQELNTLSKDMQRWVAERQGQQIFCTPGRRRGENGAEVPQNEDHDERWKQATTGVEITVPGQVNSLRKSGWWLRVGSGWISRWELCQKIHRGWVIRKVWFSASNLEEYLLSAQSFPAVKYSREESGNIYINMDLPTIYDFNLLILNSIIWFRIDKVRHDRSWLITVQIVLNETRRIDSLSICILIHIRNCTKRIVWKL
jgi:hypothetical protein